MKMWRKILSKFITAFIAGTLLCAPVYSASNFEMGEIIPEDGWATDYNKEQIVTHLTEDLDVFRPETRKENEPYKATIEVKAGVAFVGALSRLGQILDRTLVPFVMVFIIIAFIFWLIMEIYNMISDGKGAKDMALNAVKKGMIVSIWLVILGIGPSEIFKMIMVPVINIGTMLSNIILESVSETFGAQINDYTQCLQSGIFTDSILDAKTSAGLICMPAQISTFFHTAVDTGFSWMKSGFGHSAIIFFIGLGLVAGFIFLTFKFAFMALGIIADLFLTILMLPFTAIAESTNQTAYKGMAGIMYNGFLDLFKTQKLDKQVLRFINAIIYCVALSIVIAICAGILKIAMPHNMAAIEPTTDSFGNSLALLTTVILVAYLANQAESIAKSIGGDIETKVGEAVKTSAKKIWDNSYGRAMPWIREYRKSHKK